MDSNIAAMIIGGVILIGLGIPCLASLCKIADELKLKSRRDRKLKLAMARIGQMAGRRLTAVRDVPVVLEEGETAYYSAPAVLTGPATVMQSSAGGLAVQ